MIVGCTVQAGLRWNDAGLDVKEGDGVAIRAAGTWTDSWVVSGPEGFAKPWLKPVNWTKRARRANWFELVAVVGRCDGPYWRYTQGGPLVALRGGRVQLFANDAWHMYWNNKGFLEVELERLS